MAQAAAAYVAETVALSVAERGICVIGLSGNGTPPEFYRTLAQPPYSTAIPWSQTHLFMGDERWVPFTDAQSNAGMIMRELTDKVPIPESNLHFIQTQEITPEASARQHEAVLRSLLPMPGMPRIDIMLHALAPDGHTASLEVGGSAYEERDHIEAAVTHTWLPRVQDWRVTVTYALVCHARHILFVTNSDRRAAAVRKVFSPKLGDDPIPSAFVKANDGTLVWFVDKDAASLVSGQNIDTGV
jgi:6-phosphogluconolactonase